MSKLVERRTFNVKRGRLHELVELFKAEQARVGGPGRIYTYIFGPRDVLIHEATFESEEEQKRFWEDWASQPEAREFMKKADELYETGGAIELLQLH